MTKLLNYKVTPPPPYNIYILQNTGMRRGVTEVENGLHHIVFMSSIQLYHYEKKIKTTAAHCSMYTCNIL